MSQQHTTNDMLRKQYQMLRQSFLDKEIARLRTQAHQPPTDPWRNFVPAGMEPPVAVERAQAMLPQGGKGGHDFSDGKNCRKCGASFGKWALGSVGKCEPPPPPPADPSDPVPVRWTYITGPIIAPDPRSEGIARAVDRLSHFEPRLGAARWQP